MATHGDMLSMPVCHFGVFLGFLGWPILARRRTAMTTSATPMSILTAMAAREGAVLGLGGLFPVTRTVRAITAASESSHPKMKAAPLRTPPLDIRTRMKAVSGMGSRVMTSAIRTRSRITGAPQWALGPAAAVGQSLLWRNFLTNTTTNRTARTPNTMPPM